jgi:GntR family carbon starvation induced transcriptional regulator
MSTFGTAVVEADAPEPRSLIETAYRCLREDIVCGRLAPGSRLRIDILRSSYGIGATPLREALSRLSAVGLVEASPQRGFRVTPVSEEDLDDITRQRVRFEVEALRESIAYGDDRWEANVVATHHRLRIVERALPSRSAPAFNEYEIRNRDFHEALVSACRSPWTLRFRAMIYDHHERYRRLSMVLQTASMQNVGRQHAAIKDAALDRNADVAAALTEKHIMRTVEVVRTSLAAGGEGADRLQEILGSVFGVH